jgi:hypothetical protein
MISDPTMPAIANSSYSKCKMRNSNFFDNYRIIIIILFIEDGTTPERKPE